MAKLTRRGFFKHTSVSVATLGMLAAVSPLAAVPEAAPEVPTAELTAASFAEPLVAHVSDLASGEVSIMVGTREVIYRDPEFVMRLLRAVQ